jgi:hypothetical protein
MYREPPLGALFISTHHVSVGDWIITGVKGDRYPCKPDIFAATYDPEPSGGAA